MALCLSQTGPSQEVEGEGEKRQRQWILKREPRFLIPTDQAVPRYDPKWDPENDTYEWSCNHFINCILEGLSHGRTARTLRNPSSFPKET
jgi:hypothetical protein